jgi:hypothetical protein
MSQAQLATHKWKDCPDNPANKSRTERGEVSSMEKKNSFVQFKPNVEEIEPDQEGNEVTELQKQESLNLSTRSASKKQCYHAFHQ